MSTSNYKEDHNFYLKILGAQLIWEFEEFSARVAAFDLAGEPFLLIADHVGAPSKRLIYEVENIAAEAKQLKERGWFGRKQIRYHLPHASISRTGAGTSTRYSR